MLGNAAGPEPHVLFGGGAQHPARLMVVLVGEASLGRKGTATNAAQRLFEEADPRWACRIKGGLKSPEAMIALVDDRGDDARLCMVEPEFARFAETMSRTEFSPGCAQPGTAAYWRTRSEDPKRSFRASHAHISLVGIDHPPRA